MSNALKHKKKIKIAYVIDAIDYNIGGTERQLILLLKHLDRTRFEPYLCCFKNTKWLRDHNQDYNVYFFQFDSFYSLRDYINLLRYSMFLKAQGMDIVQTHFRDGNIIGIIAARLAGVNTIISTRRNQGYWHDRKEIVTLKILNRFVTNFLANSKVVKSYVHNVEGVLKDKIEVIYNGFETDQFTGNSDAVKSQELKALGVYQNGPVIVNVSNLRPVKGVDVFLKAAKIVIDKYKSACFLIVGDGPEKEKLINLTEELGIVENVTFLGSRDDIGRILSLSDIGVLSSHSEGLSNSVIEYMASSLPVVCTDVGGNSELIVDDINGVLTPPENPDAIAAAIIKLLNNPQIMSEMGMISRKRADSTFNLKKIIEDTENYYMKLVNGVES